MPRCQGFATCVARFEAFAVDDDTRLCTYHAAANAQSPAPIQDSKHRMRQACMLEVCTYLQLDVWPSQQLKGRTDLQSRICFFGTFTFLCQIY